MKNKITKTLLALALSNAMCVTPFTGDAAQSSMCLIGTSVYSSSRLCIGTSYGVGGNTNYGYYSGGTSNITYVGESTAKKQSCIQSMVKDLCVRSL